MREIVSIAKVVSNGAVFAKQCISSILLHTDVPFSLTIVDNGSTDEQIVELLNNVDQIGLAAQQENPYCLGLHLIQNPENYFICKATNQGFKNRQGEWVVFIPSDIIVPENYLSMLLKVCEQRKLDGISPRWYEPKHIGQHPDLLIHWVGPPKCKMRFIKGLILILDPEKNLRKGGWSEFSGY